MMMLSFFTASEILKNTPRKGWVIRGIQDGESVAEHMYQMGLICLAYPWVRISQIPRPSTIVFILGLTNTYLLAI